ncbi:signal recognition particle-docking protein FtsY [Yokenella regensburgei]|uniref:signal recognition particle-docking protein FtsY n=1 Tax=Yokenella regensburgei TaxID=158877 RepID=UPI00289874B1|nr:signal recognition particle-docking protein FtsY [Yokenella regensburgei]
MAKEKKRGLFSWLGFGQKEQAPEPEAEQQVNEQPVAAEEHKEEAPAEAVAETVVEPVVEPEPEAEAPAHSKAEIDAFAEEIVDVTEEVIEHEKPQPVEAPVVETAAVEKTVVEEAAVEVVAQPEPEVPEEPEISDEELEAQALAAVETPEEAVIAEAEEEPVPEEEVEPEAEAAPQQEQEKPTKEGFFARLKRSLVKTKENLGSGFISLFRGKKIDDDLFEELEEQLLIADVGVDTTRKIIANLTEGASRKQLRDAEALYGLLKEEMGEILAKVDEPLNIEGKTPFVILMVGVNGVGKTTTIGKLARQFEQQGKSVMLAAGDTFRAAAVEQLQVWGQRNNIPVVAQHTGADSASVIFDAIQAAKARNIDVLIADTAGRLQNKSHLMEELKKIVRVMKKLDVDAPHEVMLTIDASTGQNAISQAKLFDEAVGLTGITLTKLDGTAKGGVIFSVADQFNIPIRYIGVGERIEDLRPFNAGDFIEALFARED